MSCAVFPELDLECGVAAFDGRKRIGHHLVDAIDADRDVGRKRRRAAAEQAIQRCAVALRPQVVERDLDRRLGAAVAFQRVLDQPEGMVQVVHVLPDQARADVVADRGDDGAVGVAGDRGGRRGRAVAETAIVGLDRHDDVFRRLHAAQGRDERRLQRRAQQAKADVDDLHFVPFQ
jgi:hypothetical protein